MYGRKTAVNRFWASQAAKYWRHFFCSFFCVPMNMFHPILSLTSSHFASTESLNSFPTIFPLFNVTCFAALRDVNQILSQHQIHNSSLSSSSAVHRLLHQKQETVRAVPALGEDVRQPCVVARQHAGLPGHPLRRLGLSGGSCCHSLRAGSAAIAHHQTRGTHAPPLPPPWEGFWIHILFLFLLPAHLHSSWYFRQPANHTYPHPANPLHLLAPLHALLSFPVPSGSRSHPSCLVPVTAALLGYQTNRMNLCLYLTHLFVLYIALPFE